MQLTIERSALLKALGHVQSVVERRNTIPILSNVLLSAGRDKLAFAATDLDMEMVDEAEAVVNVEGQITAPAHTLYEIVRKLQDGAEVSLSYNGDDPRLVVSAGRSKFNLPLKHCGQQGWVAQSPVEERGGPETHRQRRPTHSTIIPATIPLMNNVAIIRVFAMGAAFSIIRSKIPTSASIGPS